MTATFTVKVWDIETTNLRSDIGTLIIASFLDIHTGEIVTRTIKDFRGNEKRLVLWVREQMVSADVLIGHNSTAFDRNFISGVLGRYGLEPLPPRMHVDTYHIARYGFKGIPQSYSMANLADLFSLVEKKDQPSKHDWREAGLLTPEALNRIKERCEADVRVNALLWEKLRPYWHLWKGTR
jgi:DNA polymerase III epsilon subunit-like protein